MRHADCKTAGYLWSLPPPSLSVRKKKNPIKYQRRSKKTCFPVISIWALWTFTVYPPCESLWRITLTLLRETLIKAVVHLFLLCHLSPILSFLQALFKSKPRPLICVPCLVIPPLAPQSFLFSSLSASPANSTPIYSQTLLLGPGSPTQTTGSSGWMDCLKGGRGDFLICQDWRYAVGLAALPQSFTADSLPDRLSRQKLPLLSDAGPWQIDSCVFSHATHWTLRAR